jgi:hypothetical protein
MFISQNELCDSDKQKQNEFDEIVENKCVSVA